MHAATTHARQSSACAVVATPIPINTRPAPARTPLRILRTPLGGFAGSENGRKKPMGSMRRASHSVNPDVQPGRNRVATDTSHPPQVSSGLPTHEPRFAAKSTRQRLSQLLIASHLGALLLFAGLLLASGGGTI